jgi:predicted aminopeptidase
LQQFNQLPRHSVFHRCRSLLVLALLLPLSGCYLLQAAGGQMQIVSKREPIDVVLRDPATPEKVRTRLEYAQAARDFASRELGLPDNASYRSYADIGRSNVVWNVFATEEFSIEPRRWCFPVVGCVVYRGYFKEESARRYARHLRAAGYDAMVGGVAAYSTLGHFKDPILNTMIEWSDAQLAATLFHELAHQLIYVPGDSEFNETFATAVEEMGLERWLISTGRPQDLAAWRKYQDRQEQFIELLLQTREKLRVLYASALPEAEMRARKEETFGQLKFEYTQLRASWNGYAGYDGWFDRALSNAHLVSAATYHGCLPGFTRVLNSVDGDLPRFYAEIRRIAALPKEQRTQAICTGPDSHPP